MTKFEIIVSDSNGILKVFDTVEAETVAFTPAGFALYDKHEVVYCVPHNCGVRKG